MDIGSLSIAMSQSSIKNQVSIALTKMSMDSMENTAANLNEMMGTVATNPNLGRVIDVSV